MGSFDDFASKFTAAASAHDFVHISKRYEDNFVNKIPENSLTPEEISECFLRREVWCIHVGNEAKLHTFFSSTMRGLSKKSNYFIELPEDQGLFNDLAGLSIRKINNVAHSFTAEMYFWPFKSERTHFYDGEYAWLATLRKDDPNGSAQPSISHAISISLGTSLEYTYIDVGGV